MRNIIKCMKAALNIFIILVFLMLVVVITKPIQKDNNSENDNVSISRTLNPFALNKDDIILSNTNNTANVTNTSINNAREDVLNKAKEMIEVKWTPKYDLADKNCVFTFIKGKTYYGIPYSMDFYQVRSASDFLNKINGSKTLIGNDCSGFVSAAWGISRQTTLTLYNAAKNGNKVDNKSITQISWENLKPGDALLLQDGKGKGHIMLFLNFDSSNKDNICVYEQNITTTIPYEPIPVARKDIRSMEKLKKSGYVPITISTLN